MPPKKKKPEKLNTTGSLESQASNLKSPLPKAKPQRETTPKETSNKRTTTPKEVTKKERVTSAKERKRDIDKADNASSLKPPLPRLQRDATRRETPPKDKKPDKPEVEKSNTKLFQKEDYESKKKGKKEIEAEEILEGDKPGSVAIFGRGSAKKRNKVVVEEETPPTVQDDIQIPSLWIRGGNGVVHLLDKPPDPEPVIAPSAEKKKGKRKKKKLKKTDSFKDFYEANKKAAARTRSGSSKSFYKPDSGKKTGPVYAAFLINEEMLKLSTAVGVKITLDAYVEPTEDKKDGTLEGIGIAASEDSLMDINAAFHSKQGKIELLPQMGIKDKKRDTVPIIRRRAILKAKTRHGFKKDTYMHHTPHPNLMTPLFNLPPIKHMLYGPYENQVERVVNEVRKPVKYRGQEQLIFPENAFASDSTFIEKIVNIEPFLLLAKNAQGAAVAQLIQDALAAPGVYSFSELLESPNVQQLANHPSLSYAYKQLEIFCYGTLQDYQGLPELNPQQLLKLKYLTLVTLSENKILPYQMLLQQLQINNVRELEDLIISAIYSDIISGKMDQKRKSEKIITLIDDKIKNVAETVKINRDNEELYEKELKNILASLPPERNSDRMGEKMQQRSYLSSHRK
ncbi:hypothetical protein HDV06_002429 [Boothiomyces sp. JEL0866]|nr:hypothetical protein HDV06_002429 [Boothiomyces sp. JEL0866]